MQKMIFIFMLTFINCIYSQCDKDKSEWEDYFEEKGPLDQLEGIWSVQSYSKSYQFRRYMPESDNQYLQKIAIYKNGENFSACTVDAKYNGKHLLSYESTANPNLYLVSMKHSKTGARFTLNNGFFNFNISYDGISGSGEFSYISDYEFIKIFPSTNINNRVNRTGTGFAISENGYIVTNYHVVENANSIKVKGVNGFFSKSYIAKVVVKDLNNDLAIIKIDDAKFQSLGTIPYSFNRKRVDVGNNIYVLGYPLLSSMGDEIKLTNGIISAKSGFQGDVTSYQISASAQPGNSGGPLLDESGNIIGIVNSKHQSAENATYAIKANYLFNLIDVLDDELLLPRATLLKGKSLSEQVKEVKPFVYIIDIN